MKDLIKAFILPLAIFISGCEVILDMEDPYPGPHLVINSLINPDSTIRVDITETRSIMEEDLDLDPYYLPVQGVNIRLFEDGEFVGDLTEVDTGFYTRNFYPKANKSYTIEASKNGYPTASATTYIPSLNADILDIDFDLIKKYSYDSWKSINYDYLVNLQFKDGAGTDYYEIQSSIDSYMMWYDYPDESSDYQVIIDTTNWFNPLLTDDLVFLPYAGTDQYQHKVFNDELFDQQEKVISLKASCRTHDIKEIERETGQIIRPQIHIQLRSLSYDYYAYFISYIIQVRSKENPFAEPAPVYSNVEGGFGVFAGFNAQIRSATFPME